jgi:hypothetical protein
MSKPITAPSILELITDITAMVILNPIAASFQYLASSPLSPKLEA